MIRGAPLAALKSSIAQMVFTRWTLGKSGRGFFQSACSGWWPPLYSASRAFRLETLKSPLKI